MKAATDPTTVKIVKIFPQLIVFSITGNIGQGAVAPIPYSGIFDHAIAPTKRGKARERSKYRAAVAARIKPTVQTTFIMRMNSDINGPSSQSS
jgi:hypothetical protein